MNMCGNCGFDKQNLFDDFEKCPNCLDWKLPVEDVN